MGFDTKEKTTLNSSVAADEGRSHHNNTVQSIPACATKINTVEDVDDAEERLLALARKMERMNDPAYLPTVTLQDLFEHVYQTRPAVIDDLLYTGTYLFAGAPKVGKSFLMAQLAYHVSTGQSLWGYDVRKGTVLYLALEDDYQRLQRRMFRMFGVEEAEQLHFAVCAKQLGNGLDRQLERFVKEHPDTRLIIIDTLQKIRKTAGEAYSYADDYQIIGKLKQFSDQHGLCLLIVHHTRKTQAGDKFEMISGTTGLLGCADAGFILQKEKRTDNTAILDVVGRDQPDQRIYLVRDEARLLWNFDHTEKELWKAPPDPLLEKLVTLLTPETPEWRGSATDLLTALNLEIPANALTKKLNVQASKLLNDYHICYKNIHSRNGSQISLTLTQETV